MVTDGPEIQSLAGKVAKAADARREVCLTAAVSLAEGEFDPSKVTDDGGDLGGGVIPNVAILTAGTAFPASDEPFEIDEVMLQQCAESINSASPPVKSRVSHPELAGGPMWVGGDSIFHLTGQCRNAVVKGRQVRADMHIGSWADDGPNGAIGTRVKKMARTAPHIFGTSLRFLRAEYEQREGAAPLGRIYAVTAVDFVGTPGGNPNGLLSGQDAKTTETGRGEGTPGTIREDEKMKINAKQRAFLTSCGLGKDATDEQVATLAAGLKPDQKTYLESLAAGAGDEPIKDNPPPTDKAKEPASQLAGDEAASKASEQQTLAADRERRKGIEALAAGDAAPVSVEVARKWADDGVSLSDARRLTEMAKAMKAVPTGRVDVGEDRNLATLAGGISDAILLRVGSPLMTFDRITGLAARDAEGRIVARQPHARALTMQRMPIPELARQYLAGVGLAGSQLTSLSGEEVINIASCRRGEFGEKLRAAGGSVELAMSTSDFPYILADALNKVFLGGFNLAPSTWGFWCGRQTTRDFKDVKLLNVSEAPAMALRLEGAGISYGSLSETREVVALVEYTSGLVFTRRMQINDDLGVFRDGGARGLGAIARYQEDNVVYAILTANALMADGVALFSIATHANLSAGSSTAVYAATASGMYPTVVALFLESEQAPVLKQEVQWDTDDLKVAVRHSVAAKAVDYRGLYKDVTGNVTVASLAAILEAMVSQTGPNGAFLNLRPAYIICPAGTKEVLFAQLVGSSVDPSKANATPNPFLNKLTVIGEPRLI